MTLENIYRLPRGHIILKHRNITRYESSRSISLLIIKHIGTPIFIQNIASVGVIALLSVNRVACFSLING